MSEKERFSLQAVSWGTPTEYKLEITPAGELRRLSRRAPAYLLAVLDELHRRAEEARLVNESLEKREPEPGQEGAQ